MENSPEAQLANEIGWRHGLAPLLADIATQINARAEGEGWVVDGAVSDEGGANQGAVQCLLLEASMVRSFFMRALNRFQSTLAGERGISITEVSEVRQEALEIFDRISTGVLSNWILQLQAPAEAGSEMQEGEAGYENDAPAGMVPIPAAPESNITILEELRSCINSIGSQVGKLRAFAPPGSEAPTTVVRQLQRMGTLLEGLGAPSKSVTEPLPTESVRVAPLAVRAFVEALGEAFRPLAEQKGLRFAIHVDSALTSVETDAPKLQRAASLLIGNAVHYTAKGGVSLSARATTGDWLLSVEDTGPGIEPNKLSRLLTGAVLGPDRVPHGLAVTRELVQLLGGHLDADSVLTRGSRFTICLPRARRGAFSAPAPSASDSRRF
jgi:signal transduction histidine kinase